MEVTSGFLVLKTFERMYREYLIRFEKRKKIKPELTYVPIPLEQMPGRYRGIARDSIEPWIEDLRGSDMWEEPTEQELKASLFMHKLCESGKADNGFIFRLDDAKNLLEMISKPVERELIWAGRMDKGDRPPPGTEILGYEPIDFDGDDTSLIADVFFFSYFRPADYDYSDRTRTKNYPPRLNKWGLFDSSNLVQQYVDSFQPFPEHERPEHIAEVRIVK